MRNESSRRIAMDTAQYTATQYSRAAKHKVGLSEKSL